MRPLFLAAGQAPPPGALVVDCGVAGGAATYSHWRDAPVVADALAADTSAGMLALAARAPDRWLAGFSAACNDHVDADGLIALALACRPGLAATHATLLVGAAEAGDFCAWPDEAAFRLMLRLHQLVRDQRAVGAGWEQRCCDQAVDDADRLIADSARADPERDAQVAQVLAARARLAHRDGIAIDQLGDLAVVAWGRRLGHAGDSFLAVHQPDDLPPWALDGCFAHGCFQLLAEGREAGTAYLLDAPRHSWARTVHRPQVPWPDLERARLRLQSMEPGACRWVIRPEAARVGFVCLLASVDAAGLPAASGLPAAPVAAAIREALRARRPAG